MTFTAEMRLGSLELVAALAVFAVLAARGRSPLGDAGVRVQLDIHLQSPGAGAQPMALTVTPGTAAIVGRSHNAQAPVDDPEVSRRHAQFETADGLLYAADLGSANGTFLNGKRLGGEGIEVRSGDYIDVGNSRIVIRAVRSAE